MKKQDSIRNDKNIKIGSNIKRIRKSRNMKSVDLIREVNLLGIDLNTFSLSKIEACSQHITASQFKAIRKVLCCEYEDLLKES